MARLVRLAHTLPVVDVELHELGQIDTNYWFEAGQPTVRKVVQRRYAFLPATVSPEVRLASGGSRSVTPANRSTGALP